MAPGGNPNCGDIYITDNNIYQLDKLDTYITDPPPRINIQSCMYAFDIINHLHLYKYKSSHSRVARNYWEHIER